MSLFSTPYIRSPVPDTWDNALSPDFFNYDDVDVYRLEVNLSPCLPPHRGLSAVVEYIELEQHLDSCPKNDSPEKHIKEACRLQESNEENVQRLHVRVVDRHRQDADLTSSERDDLQKRIDEICHPRRGEKTLLFILSNTPHLRARSGHPIPPEWVSMMLRRYPTTRHQLLFHERGLYVHLEADSYLTLKQHHEKMIRDVNQWLLEHYEQGILPYVFSDSFSNDWGLELTHINAWRPILHNPRVMGDDLVLFYTRRVQRIGTKYLWITPTFENREISRRFQQVLQENGTVYQFSQERFYVEVDQYEEAKNLMHLLHYGTS